MCRHGLDIREAGQLELCSSRTQRLACNDAPAADVISAACFERRKPPRTSDKHHPSGRYPSSWDLPANRRRRRSERSDGDADKPLQNTPATGTPRRSPLNQLQMPAARRLRPAQCQVLGSIVSTWTENDLRAPIVDAQGLSSTSRVDVAPSQRSTFALTPRGISATRRGVMCPGQGRVVLGS